MTHPSDEALIEAALELYRRYQREFVERHSMCPYAKPARELGSVSTRVVVSQDLQRAVLAEIQQLATQSEVEVALLICPLVRASRVTWERWVSALVSKDAELHPPGRVPFAMAAFHPDAEVRSSSAASLVPFIRRSPDPTIQLVAISALERVRKGFDEGTTFLDPSELDFSAPVPRAQPSLREKICDANQRTLQRLGLQEAQRILDDIARQRDETYERLGVSQRPSPI